MIFARTSRSKELVGLDLGTSSIKAVHLQRIRSSYRLAELGIVSIPSEMIVDGIIIDAAAVSAAIRQLFHECRIALKDVAVSVSGPSVIIKKIKVPAMKASELREGIRWEAQQHIPYAIDDVNLDFEVLRWAGPGEPEMDVVLVAVKKDTLHEYLAAISAAGLNAVVVDVDAFAIENAFTMTQRLESSETIALVNVGAAVTNINILYDGISDFTRDSPIGGNRHTESLQRSMGLDVEQAEALKKGKPVEGRSCAEAESAFEIPNGELAGEIRRSLDFYYSTTRRRTIHRVVLSGGCALLPGLSSYLTEALELPVEVANPFRHIAADSKKYDAAYLAGIAPQMTVAVGLALREAGDHLQ